MEMSQRKRFWFVLFSVILVAAVVILAGGVSSLDVGYRGRPLPDMRSEAEQPEAQPPRLAIDEAVLRVLLTVAAVLLPFAVIYYIVSPEARRSLLQYIIALLIVLLPFYFLQSAPLEIVETEETVPAPQEAPQDLPPAPEVAPAPSPSNWWVVVATIGAALLLAAFLVVLGWSIWRHRQRPPTSLDRLAQEAQDAVEAIEAGADLRDTVTRCYFEMMQILKEERGIQRQRGMTPREFEAQLEGLGIPTAQVRRLTRLFEQVRYGDKRLGQREERQAVVSLTAIARFCRSAS